MQADFHSFQLGRFQYLALSDGGAEYQLESMVANAPRTEVQAYLQSHGLPDETIFTPYTYLFVNTGKHRILVDMGAGDLFSTTGRLLQSMEQAGLAPESIDSVFISHAHPDHVGGVVNAQGELNFPNAQYFIWHGEWNFWFSEQAQTQVGEEFITFARRKLTPLKEKITLLEDENEVLPGVRAISAPGHTPGHMVIAFESEGTQLLYTGDTVLHPLHLERPDWLPIYDILPDLANLSKQHVFDLAASTRSLVLGQHFPPFPNLGHILKKESGWLWQPIEPQR